MIGKLTGVLLEKNPPQILIDCHGVGYEVDVPMSTFFNLPGLGEKVTLLTHFVVREDAQQLFGFLTDGERQTFRQLVRISGVGPRTALSILSGLSVDDLASAGVFVDRRSGGRGCDGRRDLIKVEDRQRHRLFRGIAGAIGGDNGEGVGALGLEVGVAGQRDGA